MSVRQNHPTPTRPRHPRRSILATSQRLQAQILAAKLAGDHEMVRIFAAQQHELADAWVARIRAELGR